MEVDPEDTTPISQGRQRRVIKEPTKFTPDKGEVSQVSSHVVIFGKLRKIQIVKSKLPNITIQLRYCLIPLHVLSFFLLDLDRTQICVQVRIAAFVMAICFFFGFAT